MVRDVKVNKVIDREDGQVKICIQSFLIPKLTCLVVYHVTSS